MPAPSDLLRYSLALIFTTRRKKPSTKMTPSRRSARYAIVVGARTQLRRKA